MRHTGTSVATRAGAWRKAPQHTMCPTTPQATPSPARGHSWHWSCASRIVSERGATPAGPPRPAAQDRRGAKRGTDAAPPTPDRPAPPGAGGEWPPNAGARRADWIELRSEHMLSRSAACSMSIQPTYILWAESTLTTESHHPTAGEPGVETRYPPPLSRPQGKGTTFRSGPGPTDRPETPKAQN